ncbi:hypothetical protein DSO57_1020302 [Entomophthora muscae]|uniref:Uncharacterized protein n=2 Tax=Entomophthora muscae TaxID=34485 RepID=A0ACC2RV10_9FUNG|nr:hypothetical protein DSO57_1020302 [Entomophthora muscae]
MLMRPFPTWMEAAKCFERYEKLSPEEKVAYDSTGVFPEVAASQSGQNITSERAEKDRKLALACFEELINRDADENQGEGFVQGFHCKDNKKLSYKISQLPGIKKLVPNSGLTKCFKRWSSSYPNLDLFIVQELEGLEFSSEDDFKPSGGASKLIKLNMKEATLNEAKEIIDKDMRLPSELNGAETKSDSPSPSRQWRKKSDNFKYDVELVSSLSDEEIRLQLLEYLKGLEMEVDKVSRCHELTRLITEAIQKKFGGELKVSLTGSIKTSLAIKNSDLDLNIVLPKDGLSFDEVEVYLKQLVELLAELQMTKIKTIHRKGAKVPLIKCLDTSGISVDLSLGNSTTIFKTAMLAAYARLHPTVRQLLLFIKGWASAREINLPNNGTLNTYCHSTMLLAYLVMVRAIPNLQRICLNHTSFSPAIDLTKEQTCVELTAIPKCHVCGDTLPIKIHYGANVYFNDTSFDFEGDLDFLELLQGYMTFMGFSFKSDLHAISLLNGGLVPREAIGHPLPDRKNIVVSIPSPPVETDVSKLVKIDEVKAFVVEDPIDLAVNVATSGRPWSMDGLNWEFCRASHLLEAKQPLVTSLLIPFVPPISPHVFIKEGIYSRHVFFL